jgi:hypothetical protein
MLYKKTTKEYYLPGDALCLNTALALRLFEYVKETPTLTDVDLHKMVETAKAWNKEYHVLNMDAYQSIITGVSPA